MESHLNNHLIWSEAKKTQETFDEMATFSTQAATREYQMDANGELTVVERLATLLETGQFADVSIQVGQGSDAVTFKAHRLLLATASQPLNNLLSSNVKNGHGDSNVIHIKDVEPEAFFNVLKYIYTDNLQIENITEAFALLTMSKNWGLNKLVQRTVKYLDGFLELYEPSSEDKKNELCDLLVLTNGDGSDLNKKAWDILIRDVNKVVPCQGFLNFSEAMVRQLLTREDFDYMNQLTLFEAIRDWGMNQVLLRHLSVNQLQQVIEGFMVHVNFKAIKDGDFIDTVLTSACLSKGDLIAFFIARGLEIPRDLAFNNNKEDSSITKDGSTLNYEKTCRFKRGYKLPTNEVYKEHELRFRVDKRLKLLGVGFGFLFSNTDMGITVHCQGPWESRQWSDIIQTYCRVSWEKMKTADVRLMFSEAVNIEPNQCYKILVRVSRMSAGSTDVDLWGGSQGNTNVKLKDAEFEFLKAAVDPQKAVEEQDRENQPGMITDLFYQICDESEPKSKFLTSPIPGKKSSPEREISPVYTFDRSKKSPVRELTPPPPLSVHRSQRTAPPPPPRKLPNDIIETFVGNLRSPVSAEVPSPTTPTRKPISYGRTISSSRYDTGSSPSDTLPWQRKRDDSSSLYTRSHPFSTTRSPNRLPDFLNRTARQTSIDRGKPAWELPSKFKSDTSTSSTLKSREPSVNREREPSQPKYGSSAKYGRTSGTSDTASRYSSRYGSGLSTSSATSASPSTSRYSSASQNTSTLSPSRYSSTLSTSTPTSRYSSTSNSSPTTSSRYSSTSTSNPTTSSRYSSASNADKPSATPSSRYGGDSSTSRYNSGSITGRDSTASTTSRSGGGDTSSRLNGDSTNTTSRYGLSSTLGSRYGSGLSTTGSRFSTSSSKPATAATRDTTTPTRTSSALGRYSTPSSTSLGSRYSGSSSRYGSSFYRR